MIKLLAINNKTTLIGLAEIDFLNKEIIDKIYQNSDTSVSVMLVSEHLNLGTIISDGFYLLYLASEYHYLLKDVQWGKDYILLNAPDKTRIINLTQ